jgi:hypothetical protein
LLCEEDPRSWLAEVSFSQHTRFGPKPFSQSPCAIRFPTAVRGICFLVQSILYRHLVNHLMYLACEIRQPTRCSSLSLAITICDHLSYLLVQQGSRFLNPHVLGRRLQYCLIYPASTDSIHSLNPTLFQAGTLHDQLVYP